MKRSIIYLILVIVGLIACTNQSSETIKISKTEISNPTNKVILSSDIKWEKLNPARGDQSPQAGTLWGDRKGTEATGFLAKFVDGFSSPPHIHNVSYRAVVISGLIHNDDPAAENMWMPKGSFWTQPVGEAHITSAKGSENIALVEINKGPYLVNPIEEAFDCGERPINIDAGNIVWLNKDATRWVDENSNAEISFLLEDENGLKSLFIKLPAGSSSKIESDGTVFHAVVIQGNSDYTMPKSQEIKKLDAGSYFGSTSKALHEIKAVSSGELLVYVRTNGDVFVR